MDKKILAVLLDETLQNHCFGEKENMVLLQSYIFYEKSLCILSEFFFGLAIDIKKTARRPC